MLSVRLGAAGLFACLLAACTSTPPVVPSPTETGATSAAPTAQGELRVLVYGEPAQLRSYRRLTTAFLARNPEVTVRMSTAATAEEAAATLERELADGTPPDVFLAAREQLPRLVADERVLPLDALLEEREVNFGDGFLRGALAGFAANSALQCMPHDVSPLVVYYNEDLFDPASVSEDTDTDSTVAEQGWDWEQFTVAATAASRGRPSGFHLDPGIEELAPFVWSAGADIVDDRQAPSTLTLADGDTRAAIEQVLTLVRDPTLTPTPEQLAGSDAATRFADGRLAMIFGTRALTPRLRTVEGLDFDVLPLPSLGRQTTVAWMTGYCISAQTRHVAAAADLVTFAVSRRGASITSRSGHVVPSNVEVAYSPAFDQGGLQPETEAVFLDGVRRAETVPFVPGWSQVSATTRAPVERLFYAPVVDLDMLLPLIDARSTALLAPEDEPEDEPEQES